jgi:hypothetical protein
VWNPEQGVENHREWPQKIAKCTKEREEIVEELKRIKNPSN